MPRWQPTDAELSAIIAEVEKQAGEDTSLADNLLFHRLYHHEKGLYPRRGAKAVWRFEDGEWVRYKRNMSRREWIESFFPIRDVDGQIVTMKLNPAQRMIECEMLRMERANVAIRIQLLKSRQIGGSTFTEAVLYEKALREEHVRAILVAHNQDTSKLLLTISDIARTQMEKLTDEHGTRIPWNFKMRSKASYALEWDRPIYAQIQITSAATEGAGIGGTRSFGHLSEGARYQEGNTVHQGIVPSIPNRRGTIIIDESTTFGDTGKFCDDFWSAWKNRNTPYGERDNPYSALFMPWISHPLYTWTAAYGFGRELPKAQEEKILATLTDHEKKLLGMQVLVRWTPESKWVQEERWGTPKLVWENGKLVGTERATEGMREPKVAGKRRGGKMVWKRVGVGMQPVTVNQLAWRRARIEDKDIGGDLKKFDQDYPWCPEVAFMASGNPVFDPEWVNEQINKAKTIPLAFRGWIVDAVPGEDADGKMTGS